MASIDSVRIVLTESWSIESWELMTGLGRKACGWEY
jgi:hypothetical protein